MTTVHAFVLGDNIFYGAGFTAMLQEVCARRKGQQATVFGYYVNDPERYGVAGFDDNGNCLSIEEKPEHPKKQLCRGGTLLLPKQRGGNSPQHKAKRTRRTRITTVNREYLKRGELMVRDTATRICMA